MAQDLLGRLADFSIGCLNVDFNTAGATGKRCAARNAAGFTILAAVGVAASGTETLTFTLQGYTAATGGAAASAQAIITTAYAKIATALAGSETWVRFTQAAASTLAITDTFAGVTGVAQKQALIAFDIDCRSFADGIRYFGVDVADPGAASRIGTVIYIPRDLEVQRRPDSLQALLS